MTHEEYTTKYKLLVEKFNEYEKQFNIDRQNLAILFAVSNANCGIGDIITDGDKIIKITNRITILNYEIPYVRYRGDICTKKLVVSKRHEVGYIEEKHVTKKY